ncbi:PIF1 helicase-like protein [Trypanosoma theileri]|uniref:ATP-dependent DNA helicase n=1 Tax=Trypanosoma theileri TaxID=67003 RepID=A0A1X0NW19_9TRYP|nr:PIF1 helicase-like protein [Trypanosoma theileri]ORC88320.1 PIF1 helicase-like protein [Trypanosoma theileri]
MKLRLTRLLLQRKPSPSVCTLLPLSAQGVHTAVGETLQNESNTSATHQHVWKSEEDTIDGINNKEKKKTLSPQYKYCKSTTVPQQQQREEKERREFCYSFEIPSSVSKISEETPIKTRKKEDKYKKSSKEDAFEGVDVPAEKEEVLRLALDGASLFIGGDAGTGKSFLLGYIRKHLESKNLRVAVTASTGIAALASGGNTFHGTFGVPVFSCDEKDLSSISLSSLIRYDADLLSTLDVIIVDEVSMLHAGYIEALDLAARAAPGRTPQLPFGGIQVILSGDFMQLMHGNTGKKSARESIICSGVERKDKDIQTSLITPPKDSNVSNNGKHYKNDTDQIEKIGFNRNGSNYSVKNRRRLLRYYHTRPLFESPVFQKCLIHIWLNEPSRHIEDVDFLNDLRKLRRGILTYRLSRSAILNPADPNAIHLFPTRRAVSAFNDAKMFKLEGEERCFRSELQVTSSTNPNGNSISATSKRSRKMHSEILVIHFHSKSFHSVNWRRRAEEFVCNLSSQCELKDTFNLMIPPVSSRHARHLSVYVRFTEEVKGGAVKAMFTLQSAIANHFQGNSKEAAAARKLWGNVFIEVRQGDYMERFMRSALERRYAKIIQNDHVLQHKRLKIGCRVMLLRNLNTQYVNGSLGTVVSFQSLRHVRHLVPTELKVLLSWKEYTVLREQKPNSTSNALEKTNLGADALLLLPSENNNNDMSKNNENNKSESSDVINDYNDSNNNNDDIVIPVVKMDSDGKEVAIPFISVPLLEGWREGFCAVRITVMPITPAYAYTVHKIQGLTFDHPILFDGSGFFPCDHLIYVAASRVRRFSQFRMINVSPQMISVNRDAQQFVSSVPSAEKGAARWKRWKNTTKQFSETEMSSQELSLFRATWKVHPSSISKSK